MILQHRLPCRQIQSRLVFHKHASTCELGNHSFRPRVHCNENDVCLCWFENNLHFTHATHSSDYYTHTQTIETISRTEIECVHRHVWVYNCTILFIVQRMCISVFECTQPNHFAVEALIVNLPVVSLSVCVCLLSYLTHSTFNCLYPASKRDVPYKCVPPRRFASVLDFDMCANYPSPRQL